MKEKFLLQSESKFNDFLITLFEEYGYRIASETDIGMNNRFREDLIIKKNNIEYVIEIKVSKFSVDTRLLTWIKEVNQSDRIPVIISINQINDEIKSKLKKIENQQVEILDITNLLYLSQYNVELYSELVSQLPFSVENIFPQKHTLFSENSIMYHIYGENLINELNLCKKGKGHSKEYERICTYILKYLFSNELTLWKQHKKSNNGLYFFDLFCRIKDDNIKSFWSTMEQYFKSKYIIFEFKNYSKKITQLEVYKTERYLYSKALRSVAIIIAPNGYQRNAMWAAKGCLRENGKLILLFTNEDLIQMIRLKKEENDPSEYLLQKLDDLLFDLEK